jgi:phosphoribosylanthranilate isomerase
MQRTRIKFCGITRPEDAAAAAAAGADAIGLVFYPHSDRFVSVARARAILAALPPFVTPVALFVDASAAEVTDVAGQLRLTTVQLHGDEPPDMVARLGGLHVVKAIRARPAALVGAIAPWRFVPIAALLLETAGTQEPGGTGVANDWAGLAEARRAGLLDGLPPLIAAGGLTPETVGGVVRALRPFGVDVSSGIEQARGIKSVERMAALAGAVRAADDSR